MEALPEAAAEGNPHSLTSAERWILESRDQAGTQWRPACSIPTEGLIPVISYTPAGDVMADQGSQSTQKSSYLLQLIIGALIALTILASLALPLVACPDCRGKGFMLLFNGERIDPDIVARVEVTETITETTETMRCAEGSSSPPSITSQPCSTCTGDGKVTCVGRWSWREPLLK